MFANRHNAPSDPASHVVPFARKSRVLRDPNVEPSCDPRFPNAPPTPPPLLGCRRTKTTSNTDISMASGTTIQKRNMM